MYCLYMFHSANPFLSSLYHSNRGIRGSQLTDSIKPMVLREAGARTCTNFCIPHNYKAILVAVKMIVLDWESEEVTRAFPKQTPLSQFSPLHRSLWLWRTPVQLCALSASKYRYAIIAIFISAMDQITRAVFPLVYFWAHFDISR